jgi:hypothetical protein
VCAPDRLGDDPRAVRLRGPPAAQRVRPGDH